MGLGGTVRARCSLCTILLQPVRLQPVLLSSSVQCCVPCLCGCSPTATGGAGTCSQGRSTQNAALATRAHRLGDAQSLRSLRQASLMQQQLCSGQDEWLWGFASRMIAFHQEFDNHIECDTRHRDANNNLQNIRCGVRDPDA